MIVQFFISPAHQFMRLGILFLATTALFGCSEQASEIENAADCGITSFPEINADPQAFAGHTICMEGYLFRELGEWSIAGSGPENVDLLHRSIETGISQDEAITVNWDDGDRIQISGIFHLEEQCWISREVREEQDIYLDNEKCNVGNTPFSLIDTAAIVEMRTDDNSNCTEVAYEEFAEAPLAYAYRHVCMEAIIQVEFEGMGLYAPPVIVDPFPRLLTPSIGRYFEVANLGFRTGDLVLAKGILIPSESCISPDGFCIGGSDFHLRNSEILFQSRVPAREICEYISIEEIETSRGSLENQMICTEGEIALHDSNFYLVPAGFNGDIIEGQNFRASFLFIDENLRALLPGDVVSIAALSWQDRLELYEIDVLETTLIFELCETLSLADVLANPEAWTSKVVCMEGYLQPEYADWTYFLPEADEPPLQAAPTMIAVGTYHPDEENIYSGDGETVRAAGILYDIWGCRATAESLETIAAEHESADLDDLCPPANRSFIFEIYEVE